MKMVFAKSFFRSLNKIQHRNSWWYKTYEFFRYNLPWFVRNIRRFRRELWRYRTWDSGYSLALFNQALKGNLAVLKYSNEIEESRDKKVAMITRAIELLDNCCNDAYIELAEKELRVEVNTDYTFDASEPKDITESNRIIFDRAHAIQKAQWEELWKIIKGREVSQTDIEPEKQYYGHDGSDLRSWWT